MIIYYTIMYFFLKYNNNKHTIWTRSVSVSELGQTRKRFEVPWRLMIVNLAKCRDISGKRIVFYYNHKNTCLLDFNQIKILHPGSNPSTWDSRVERSGLSYTHRELFTEFLLFQLQVIFLGLLAITFLYLLALSGYLGNWQRKLKTRNNVHVTSWLATHIILFSWHFQTVLD